MLLVIDVGNTQTVLGVYEGRTLRQHWRIATDKGRTSDEYGVLLESLFRLAGLALTAIDGSIVSSVVPPTLEAIGWMGERDLGRRPLVVGPGIRTGMPILYDSPREVGADRIVNAVAAYERCKGGAIVVDFGTATTFDVISPKGEYLGGAITPGVRIAAEALFQRTSKLPNIELVRPATAIGRNTVASMQSGILFGYAALVEGMVARIRGELDFPVRVFATGGIAPLIAKDATCIEEVDPDLTLDGLRILWERNQ